LAGAVEAAHHSPLTDAQGACRFSVGEAGDVDGDEDVAEIVRERGDRGVELAGLERGLRLARLRVGDEVELIGQRPGSQPAALAPLQIQERVAKRAQQVAEVVLAAEQARAGQHARVGFLDEVLGVLARAAERPGGPVEPVEVVSELGGVERALHWAMACEGRCVRASIEAHRAGTGGALRVDNVVPAQTSRRATRRRLSFAAPLDGQVVSRSTIEEVVDRHLGGSPGAVVNKEGSPSVDLSMNTTTEAVSPSPRAAGDCRVASATAIEGIYRAQATRFRGLAAAVAGADAAGDVVQEAFARALRKRASWRGEGPLEAWLWRFVLNAARDAQRRRVRRERLTARLFRVSDRDVDSAASVGRTLDGPLRRLPSRQRDCVVLRYYGDLSYAEIAGVMGIEVGTVGALLSKAHAALRAELEREERQ
jgi:RNA polymerase sigma factor (sigma-70 family)